MHYCGIMTITTTRMLSLLKVFLNPPLLAKHVAHTKRFKKHSQMKIQQISLEFSRQTTELNWQ